MEFEQKYTQVYQSAFCPKVSIGLTVCSRLVGLNSLPAVFVVTIYLGTVRAKMVTNSISFYTYLEILVRVFNWHGLIGLDFYF